MVGTTNAMSSHGGSNHESDDRSSPSKRHIQQQYSRASLVRSATDRIPSSAQANNVVSKATKTTSTSSSAIMPYSIPIVASPVAKKLSSISQQESPVRSSVSDVSPSNKEGDTAAMNTVEGLPPLPRKKNKQNRRLSVDVSSSGAATSSNHTTMASKIKSFFTRGARSSKSTKATMSSKMAESTYTP